MQKMKRIWLSAVLFWSLLWGNGMSYAQGQTYYVDDRGGYLQTVHDDPSKIQVEEWHVRLYKLGAPTGGRDHWGLIIGKSASEVMEKLEADQAFQKRYAKWAGFDYTTEVFTYFNPLGPIAVVKPPKPASSKVASAVMEGAAKIQSMREAYKRISQVLSNNPKANNPYSGVGNVLRDYAKSLVEVEKRIRELQSKMNSEYNYGSQLDSALDDFNRSVTQTQQNHVAAVSNAAAGSWRGTVDVDPTATLELRYASGKLVGTITYITPSQGIAREELEGSIDSEGAIILRGTSYRWLSYPKEGRGDFDLDTFKIFVDEDGLLSGGFFDSGGLSGSVRLARY